MGLFNFWRSKNNEAEKPDGEPFDIPEDVVVEKEPPGRQQPVEESKEKTSFIDKLYEFLAVNYRERGYDDALVNPDISHLTQNLENLRRELFRTITMVKRNYEDYVRKLEFHIESRRRSGLIDIVDELLMHKNVALDDMKIVLKIEEEAQHKTGDGEGIFLSYELGFKNGLAAITHHEILRKN
jgi:hypothetical protein